MTFRLGDAAGAEIVSVGLSMSSGYSDYTTEEFDVTYEGDGFDGKCDIYIALQAGVNFAWFEFTYGARDTEGGGDKEIADATLEDIYDPESRPDYNFDYDYDYVRPEGPTGETSAVPEGYTCMTAETNSTVALLLCGSETYLINSALFQA